jgi:hypothetical protein
MAPSAINAPRLAACMREEIMFDISRKYRRPAPLRQRCSTYLAQTGSLHARGDVVQHISRIQPACMREKMLSDISREYRQLSSARTCCRTHRAHASSPDARDIVVRHIPRIWAACMRETILSDISCVKVACMREGMLTDRSRGHRQLSFAMTCCRTHLAHTGSLHP